ncbi:MAG: glycosyltransferase [Candidatus Rifleibacteriota bacterium]
MINDMKASIVIPVYNSGKNLTRLLESLCNQDADFSFEVVLADDGSDEDYQSLLDRFRQKLKIRYVKGKQNKGPATARNMGIKEAKGEIVVFTDSDCKPNRTWLRKMVEPFSDPSVSGVKGAYSTLQSDWFAQLAQIEFLERYELLESQPDIDFIDTYSGAYRRKDLLAVGGFDTTFSAADNEDVDLAFKIKKLGGKFVFAKDAIVEHLHREGWLNYAKLKFRRGFWRMKVYSNHPEKAGNDSYTPLTLKLQLLLIALLPFALFYRTARYLWKLFWVASCFPLMRIASHEKTLLVFIIPVFCFIRGISLVSGIISGLIAEKGKYLRHYFQ